jgi:hypothetical protein
MNSAWWDGKMPVEHYREEHELDVETWEHPTPPVRPGITEPDQPGSATAPAQD